MMSLGKKILMLGWEFPPYVSGGLARATYGLVKSLSQLLEITIILPKKGNNHELPGVSIIGCNYKEDIKKYKLQEIQEEFDVNQAFDIHFSSYPNTIPLAETKIGNRHTNKTIVSEELLIPISKIYDELPGIEDVFSGNELYGAGLHRQKKIYTKIAGKIALSLDFDLIHAHDWVTYEAGMNIKELTGKPLVLHVHSLEIDRVDENVRNEIFNLEKRAMQMADAIIPVSEYTKQRISRIYGINEEKIFPVHNGINLHDIERWRHVIKKKIVAFVGRITSQKGPIILAKTAELIVKKNKDILFVVAGKGDKLDELVKFIAERHLSRYFIFTGFLSAEQVDSLLATADVYIMPSVSEPFGLSALEAVQAGTPCVLSRQSGVSEVLPDSPVADFWDVELFADHILKILADEKLGKSIGLKNKQRLKEINWDIAALKVFAIYDLLTNTRDIGE